MKRVQQYEIEQAEQDLKDFLRSENSRLLCIEGYRVKKKELVDKLARLKELHGVQSQPNKSI